ncbi:hypothetical protein OROHE_006489 [Orobanche hederae]
MAAFFASRSTRREELQRRNLNKQLPYLVGNIVEDGEDFVNPWFVATLKNLLQRMNSQVVKYEKIFIAGPGGFAQVFKAYLKMMLLPLRFKSHHFLGNFTCTASLTCGFQKMKKSFGFAHRLYLYSDYSDGKEEDKNTCRR